MFKYTLIPAGPFRTGKLPVALIRGGSVFVDSSIFFIGPCLSNAVRSVLSSLAFLRKRELVALL